MLVGFSIVLHSQNCTEHCFWRWIAIRGGHRRLGSRRKFFWYCLARDHFLGSLGTNFNRNCQLWHHLRLKDKHNWINLLLCISLCFHGNEFTYQQSSYIGLGILGQLICCRVLRLNLLKHWILLYRLILIIICFWWFLVKIIQCLFFVVFFLRLFFLIGIHFVKTRFIVNLPCLKFCVCISSVYF